MKFKHLISAFLLNSFLLISVAHSQSFTADQTLSKIKIEGFTNSKVMNQLSEFTDVYGARLTGTREYLKAATWMLNEMKEMGLSNAHFEPFCTECRGWSIKSFNVELIEPNYMHLNAYPLVMSQSTNGIIEGEVIQIESFSDMKTLKTQFKGKLKGKVILLGKEPKTKDLTNKIVERFSDEELKTMSGQMKAESQSTPLPELLKSWETSDFRDDEFLHFAEAEGAIAIFKARPFYLGTLLAQGTYYYKNGDYSPIPYFYVMPEHAGRMIRMLSHNTIPKVRINLDTELYHEPKNNVNIIAEIPGTDPKFKDEVVMVGAHFDSWHSGTGATDNGANAVVLVEALRILKQIGYTPKRTIRVGLWGGEEQAFLGSVAYAKEHYDTMKKLTADNSRQISAYLNLDNGAGLIRGVYLQNNEFARPYFKRIFDAIPELSEGALTIENTFSTDHETFDYYGIPSFQFIQDAVTYNTVNHHTNLDTYEYVPEEDTKKNAVIVAWTIYSISEMNGKMPRKK